MLWPTQFHEVSLDQKKNTLHKCKRTVEFPLKISVGIPSPNTYDFFFIWKSKKIVSSFERERERILTI